MKHLFIVLFTLAALLAGAQKKVKLELTFKYLVPQCETKKPSKVATEAPLANWRFYVYQNNNCIDSIRTNDSGKVIVKYYPGEYFLFESWKHFKRTPDNSPMSDFYKDCLVKEWAKPNYKVTIADEDFKMDYYDISASRCSNQYACLKVRHLPSQIKRK